MATRHQRVGQRLAVRWDMREIKRILCPIDFSETSAHAIDLALAVARWSKANITALHVHTPAFMPRPGLPGREGLAADLSRLRDETAACFRGATDTGVVVDVVVDVGQPASRILECAAALAADVVVIGTHGTSGFEHLVLGSVTERVLRKAACAVLTVPPRARATSTLPFTRLLCPVDFSAPSLAALQLARSLANESGSALTVLHVIEWPWREPPAPFAAELPPAQAEALAEYRRYVETSAMARLEGLMQEGAADRAAPVPRLSHGRSYVEILRAAADERADLIVMGVHGRNILDMTVFGSTTNHVVRQATCPVLTLRR
jgi:nucleotide-binding universal stress UspA family protein